MFDTWISQFKTILGLSTDQRSVAPFWKKAGPTWYLSPWWPGEKLESKQYSLLSLLAICNTERLDPKPLVGALAAEHRGGYRRRLLQLARRLDANTTLISALEKTPDALSQSVVLALRFGSQSGTLARTYEQLLATEKPEVDEARTMQLNARGYWVVLAATIVLIHLFLMYFISPTIKKVLDEFEMKPPISFYRLLVFWELVSAYAFWVCLALFALGWIVWSSRSRRFFRRQVADRLFRRTSLSRSAQLLRMLAVTVQAGRPLAGSLSTLAKYHFDRNIRQRLLMARNEVEQGAPAWSSLVDAKILSPEEFQAVTGSSNRSVQSWTLRRLATVKQEIAKQRMVMLTTFLHPVVILGFAAIVLWICFSFFSVLTKMVQSLAG